MSMKRLIDRLEEASLSEVFYDASPKANTKDLTPEQSEAAIKFTLDYFKKLGKDIKSGAAKDVMRVYDSASEDGDERYALNKWDSKSYDGKSYIESAIRNVVGFWIRKNVLNIKPTSRESSERIHTIELSNWPLKPYRFYFQSGDLLLQAVLSTLLKAGGEKAVASVAVAASFESRSAYYRGGGSTD